MDVSHSQLFNDFLSFYFVTTVDGRETYETLLDFHGLSWNLYEKDKPDTILHSEMMQEFKGVAGEDAEVERIKGRVAQLVSEIGTTKSNRG